MEVVGAVASVYGIAEALVKIPKIIGILNSVRHLRSEVAQVINELGTIRLMHRKIDKFLKSLENGASNRDVFDTRLLTDGDWELVQAAERDLKVAIAELEKLCDSCQDTKGMENETRLKRWKWLLNRHQLPAIHQQIHRARENLHMTLTLLSSQTTHYANMRGLAVMLDVQQLTMANFKQLDGLRPLIAGLSGNGADSAPEEDDTAGDAAPADNSGHVQHETEDAVMKTAGDAHATSQSRFLDDELIRIQAKMLGICLPNCRCQCHFTGEKTWRVNPLAQVLGSFVVNMGAIPIFQAARCDKDECMRRRPSISVEYYVPAWLCRWGLYSRSSVTSMAGFGATLHFTVRRIMDPEEASLIFGRVEQEDTERLKDLLRRRPCYPFDEDAAGNSMLSYALRRKWIDGVGLLIEFCEPILRQKGPGREVTAYAHSWLREEQQQYGQSSSSTKVLRKLLSFSPDAESATTTALYSAALINDLAGMARALHDEPWSLNALDSIGFAPLHVAALQDNLDALSVLLIDHNVDVNILNVEGQTPLMAAAYSGSIRCAERLLDFPCKFDRADNGGQTALHIAARSKAASSREVLQLLLSRHKELLQTRANFGETALHCLRGSTADPTLFRNKLELLLDAGADINDTDYSNNTLLYYITQHGNIECMRAVVEAGPRLDGSFGINHRTLLHTSALFNSIALLEYFRELKISGLDTEAPQANGETAWDCFICILYIPPNRLGAARRPSWEETRAFAELYRDIRDRNLGFECEILKSVLEALRGQRADDARSRLKPLAERMEKWGREDEVKTFETVDLQIRQGMWDAAVEAVEENIELRREKMTESPWQRNSIYGEEVDEWCRIRVGYYVDEWCYATYRRYHPDETDGEAADEADTDWVDTDEEVNEEEDGVEDDDEQQSLSGDASESAE
ncbi:Pfs domain-containing protein [Pleurostoma richardsiae]|uniref:Pfs domain-containing protein n=1 Tax=Pleurostoma richardsiae TaxID=41990 RepID=A0AA38R9L2_9PEZI|nr:Pfs domain-containing protein [Pleurostoma richardsiae]